MLSDLAKDRRKSYAAELMTAAWRARDNIPLGPQRETHGMPQKPASLVNLETKLNQIIGDGNIERPSNRKLDEAAALPSPVTKNAVPSTGLQMPDLTLENAIHDQLDLRHYWRYLFRCHRLVFLGKHPIVIKSYFVS